MNENKIKELRELVKVVERLKKQGKKIVTTNGVFDLLHIGHVRSFEAAKRFGDILIVGINSDSSVKKIKGDKRPIIPQKERAEMLAALEIVDYVTIFEETTPNNILDKIKPDVHIKGKNWEHENPPEKELIEKNGGKMEFIDLEQGISTTNIINRIIDAYGK